MGHARIVRKKDRLAVERYERIVKSLIHKVKLNIALFREDVF